MGLLRHGDWGPGHMGILVLGSQLESLLSCLRRDLAPEFYCLVSLDYLQAWRSQPLLVTRAAANRGVVTHLPPQRAHHGNRGQIGPKAGTLVGELLCTEFTLLGHLGVVPC